MVFVSRHLGLLICNIAIMKRFIPLFLLYLGLIWGQSNQPLSVNSLSWLTGAWEGPIGENILEEVSNKGLFFIIFSSNPGCTTLRHLLGLFGCT